MIDIVEFMLKPLADRQRHLKPNDPCLLRGGESGQHRGVLAQFLGTSFPSGNVVMLCHYCGNGGCSNPEHLYWGTSSENYSDTIRHGGRNAWERWVDAKGLDVVLEELKKRGLKGSARGGSANKGKPKSAEHRAKISASIKQKHCPDGGIGRRT